MIATRDPSRIAPAGPTSVVGVMSSLVRSGLRPALTRSARTAPIGVAVGAAMVVAGLPVAVGVGIGAAVWTVLLAAAQRRDAAASTRRKRTRIDPFAVGEPWRQFVQGAQRSCNKLRATVDAAQDGPLRDRLVEIAGKLEQGLDETWAIAQRGDAIDDTIRHLDPVGLRSRRDYLLETDTDGQNAEALRSLDQQLASVERLRTGSEQTATTLRLAQVRYDELVSRAAEITLGSADTTAYEHDVEALVIELEALRQAVEETGTA